MEKLDLHSPDLTAQNIDKLVELFPDVMTETLDAEGNPVRAIDFDLLRQELSDHVVERSAGAVPARLARQAKALLPRTLRSPRRYAVREASPSTSTPPRTSSSRATTSRR